MWHGWRPWHDGISSAQQPAGRGRGRQQSSESAPADLLLLLQALQTVDSERDILQAELDTKAEAVVQLTEELDLAHQQTDEAHRGLTAAEGRLGRADERVTAAEAETQGLRASLDSLRQHVQVGSCGTSKGWGLPDTACDCC